MLIFRHNWAYPYFYKEKIKFEGKKAYYIIFNVLEGAHDLGGQALVPC